MKYLSALAMATAMLCSALPADAKIPLEEAMRLKNQGKAMQQVCRTRDTNALRPLKPKPVSLFHKKTAEKAAMANGLSSPSRVTALGDNIFGYLGYSDDAVTELSIGYYELEGSGAKLLWKDPYLMETGLGFKNAAKVDNKIVGYIQDEVFGLLYGIYYAEIDAETGALLTVDEQDIELNSNYISIFAYNPEDERFYGYGSCDGTRAFLSAPAHDPFNYTMIKKLQGKEMCLSMCYNPAEKAIVGVNMNYELVKISTDGKQKRIMDLNVKNGDSYVTGIVYSPRSNVYYWNINYKDGTAAMATIDPVVKKVDVYEKLLNCEEYYNLMTTDDYIGNPDEPMRPEAGTPDFGKGELIGYVPFTLPSKTKGGKEIEGEVEYTTYLNGEVYTTGRIEVSNEKDDAGNIKPTTLNANFAVPEPGKYSFSMRIKANGLESSQASTYAWIGNDTPMSPANVKLTKATDASTEGSLEPGAYTVTWDPVTHGTHGGYVDQEKMEYKIRINSTIYTTSTESLNVTLPIDQTQGIYMAEVKAVCNGLESEWASSNEVTEGAALELPIYIMPTPEEYEMSLVIDNNGDGRTWSLGESTDTENPYFIQTNFTTNTAMPMDDWYFLPKMKIEETTSIYAFSMEAGLKNNSFKNEYIEVLLCDKPATDGAIATVVKSFRPENANFETVEGVFQVPKAGEYFIAIHCTSDGYQMGVKARNFVIDRSNVTADSPAEVENIAVRPGDKGALKATVTFRLPTLNMRQEEINPESTLKASISSPADTKTIEGKPGEEVSVEIATTQGINTISVQVTDGRYSSPLTTAQTYTGVHIPSTPNITSVDFTPDMLSMTINWEPVITSDEEGGYVNPETVAYDIYLLVQSASGNQWKLYKSGITETSFTYSEEPGYLQDTIILGIMARNEAGENGNLVTAMGILGTPYELPIQEDFDDQGNIYTNPWVISTVSEEPGSWGLYYDSMITGNDDDTGISMIAQGSEGVITRLGTPRFTTRGAEHASITLELFKTNLPKIRILAEMYGEEPTVIGEINSADLKHGIEKVTVNIPERYLDKDWIGLFIEAEFYGSNQFLAIESISIDGEISAAPMLEDESGIRVIPGKGTISISGLNGQNVTVANINGTVTASKTNAHGEMHVETDKGVYAVTAGRRKMTVAVR